MLLIPELGGNFWCRKLFSLTFVCTVSLFLYGSISKVLSKKEDAKPKSSSCTKVNLILKSVMPKVLHPGNEKIVKQFQTPNPEFYIRQMKARRESSCLATPSASKVCSLYYALLCG